MIDAVSYEVWLRAKLANAGPYRHRASYMGMRASVPGCESVRIIRGE
jgi:hypothetical protein